MKKYFLFFAAFFSLVAILLTAPRPVLVGEKGSGFRNLSGEVRAEHLKRSNQPSKRNEKEMLKVEAVMPERPNSARLVIEPISSEENGKIVYH